MQRDYIGIAEFLKAKPQALAWFDEYDDYFPNHTLIKEQFVLRTDRNPLRVPFYLLYRWILSALPLCLFYISGRAPQVGTHTQGGNKESVKYNLHVYVIRSYSNWRFSRAFPSRDGGFSPLPDNFSSRCSKVVLYCINWRERSLVCNKHSEVKSWISDIYFCVRSKHRRHHRKRREG